MIRTCPTCGDYYADDLLAFCLADGTPLVNVNPHSENWSEGARVIEEKENALKKQKRKLKWRRVVLSVMTMLIALMVICVVAVNSFIYFKPRQEEVVPDTPSTPATEGLVASVTPSTPGEPTPTPDKTTLTAKPTPSATPTRNNANTNPKVNNNTGVKPNTNSNVHINVNANSNINVNTDSDSPPTVCSDADKARERNIIIERYGTIWRRSIENDRREIIARAGPAGAGARLGSLGYETRFFKGCNGAFVKVRYEWRADTPVGALNVKKERNFVCGKIRGGWICS